MVYIMFWLMIFLPLLRMAIIPVPLSRLVLLALGARVGEGTYSSGLVFDPHFVTLGSQTQIGYDAVLIPHAQARGELAHYPIRIGSKVTIGARSVVLAGVTIEDGAIVGSCSLVTGGTHIPANEVWAGIPARRISGAS
jgi:acetyltransferase-like isoleucine patch superfamily enzyme